MLLSSILNRVSSYNVLSPVYGVPQGVTMLHPMETLPPEEYTSRIRNCQRYLAELAPEASGLLLSNRVNIYYCTGTFANGYLWLPHDGAPTLFVRKALDRAQRESPLIDARDFRSFGTLANFFAEQNIAPQSIAVEYNTIPYDIVLRLQNKFPTTKLVAGDMVLNKARAVKSLWELEKMRQAGLVHEKAMMDFLPNHMTLGMSEHEIGVALYTFFLNNGYVGPTRMGGFAQELFIGNVTVAQNGDYPNAFNGPQGNMGAHPATPYGGGNTLWQENTLLTIDAGYTFQGYNTDKTTVYFGGKEQDVPQAVLEAHQCCCAIEEAIAKELRPGAIPSKLYETSLAMAETCGFSEGFMGLGKNKVPFLGHGIGLVVDEWPVLAHRFDLPLENHMTLAIEPKITIPKYGMVGTENTYIVTQEGGESITGRPSPLVCLG